MNLFRQRITIGVLPITLFIIFIGTTAYAAEDAGNWRPTYDLVMRWVNFIIMVVIAVKFGKAPIKNMLAGEKIAVETEIKQFEEKKEQAEEKASNAQKMLAESHTRFNELTERITLQGERKKQAIIEDAKREGQLILDAAKHRLESQIITAKENFKSELVDAAIASAFKRLPNVVKTDDHQRFLDTYIHSLDS